MLLKVHLPEEKKGRLKVWKFYERKNETFLFVFDFPLFFR